MARMSPSLKSSFWCISVGYLDVQFFSFK